MKKILLGLILLVSSSTFSQLDSVDFSMSFVTNPTFTAGLDSTALEGEIFQVKINQDLLDSIGRISVVIYHSEDNSFAAARILDRGELTGTDLVENGKLVINFSSLDPQKPYNVIVEIQNLSLDYLPRVSRNLNQN
ncbi:hypothetical protein [Fluviicola sp.]|uniref:hypothetical protein n=1 Tax=Fluviicola sp. TaxID=1917219 RepID=UPI003D2966E7